MDCSSTPPPPGGGCHDDGLQRPAEPVPLAGTFPFYHSSLQNEGTRVTHARVSLHGGSSHFSTTGKEEGQGRYVSFPWPVAGTRQGVAW